MYTGFWMARDISPGVKKGAKDAEGSKSALYIVDGMFGVWPVHLEVSSGHHH
jgi:hypothetical protein